MSAKSPEAIERKKARNRLYNKNNKDKVNGWKHKYRLAFPNKDKEYRESHKEEIKLAKNDWKLRNPNYMRNYLYSYQNEKLASDINFRIAHNLRCRVHTAVKRNFKAGSAVKDLGCNIEEFKNYIAKKFKQDMCWDNYGGWHLDHIKPLSKFNLSDRGEFVKAAHFTNYQPLWAKDNLSKGDNYVN